MRPAVNPAEITSVMILTPKRDTSDVANVWASVGAIDSATKSIVAAGDSLARQSAAAEAAARRSAIDSAARKLADSMRRDSTTIPSAARTVSPVSPLDSAGRAKFVRDSVAAARARRARRDSLATARRADSLRRDSTVVRP
jgi:hypothetical protein